MIDTHSQKEKPIGARDQVRMGEHKTVVTFFAPNMEKSGRGLDRLCVFVSLCVCMVCVCVRTERSTYRKEL